MNENQADEIINILDAIKDKLDVVIPRDARDKKAIKYNELFKEKVRYVLFNSMTPEQKAELFRIESEIRKEVEQ